MKLGMVVGMAELGMGGGEGKEGERRLEKRNKGMIVRERKK